MRSLFLLLSFYATILSAQSTVPLEFGALHVRFDRHTVVIDLTTESGTEEFKYADHNSVDVRRYSPWKGWVNTVIQRLPEQRPVMRLLNRLYAEGWRVDQFTTSVSRPPVQRGYVNGSFASEYIIHDYLLQRPRGSSPSPTTTAADPKRIVRQLKMPDVGGESHWLVVKEVKDQRQGVDFYRRILELEQEYPQGHVVLSSNSRAVLPYAPEKDPDDRFRDLYAEEDFVVLEHFVEGDTTRRYLHYFRAFDGVYKLDKVRVTMSWLEEGCPRNDEIEYGLGTGRAIGEIVYGDCGDPDRSGARKKVNFYSYLQKRVPLFEFVFGEQKFQYGRLDPVIVPF